MIDGRVVDDIIEKLSQILPPEVSEMREELAEHFKQILMAKFSQLELVTREEFDIQKGVLAKTRAQLDLLEQTMQDALQQE